MHRADLGGTITASHLGRRLSAAGAVAAVALTGAVATQPANANPPATHDALAARETTTAHASRSTVRTTVPLAPGLKFGPEVPWPARVSLAPVAAPAPESAAAAAVPVAHKAKPAVRPAATKQRRTLERKRTTAVKSRPVAKKAPARKAVTRKVVKRKHVTRTKAVHRKVTRSTAGARRGAGAVIAYAYGALGKPYVFGAAGPRAYDCSGLTMRAYAKAGKHFAHKASSQNGRPVSRSKARPGDLVKWGGYHVGIYVGGGKVIHAPKPGDRVKKSGLWGSYRIVRVL